MFTAEEIAEHQADAESLMDATFAAFAPGGFTVVDGLKVRGMTAKGPTPGKVQSPVRQGDTNAKPVTVGGVEHRLIEGGLHIPMSKYIVANVLEIKGGDKGIGWEFQCTAVGPLADPVILGRRYLVWDVPAKSIATARRLDVVEIPSVAL